MLSDLSQTVERYDTKGSPNGEGLSPPPMRRQSSPAQCRIRGFGGGTRGSSAGLTLAGLGHGRKDRNGRPGGRVLVMRSAQVAGMITAVGRIPLVAVWSRPSGNSAYIG